MVRSRSLSGVLLALVLAITSVTMAVARGHAAAAVGGTEMVICTGYGLVKVTLDAEGNPTGPVHPCPDCVAAGAALVPQPALAPAPAGPAARQARVRPAPRRGLGRALRPYHARGPPVTA
jgi:hypothetical protein